MSPKTEHTTSLREQTSPLDVKEPSANCQLVPVDTGAPSEVATVNAQHSAIDALSPQVSTLALQPISQFHGVVHSFFTIDVRGNDDRVDA